jgi:hypothetical protein
MKRALSKFELGKKKFSSKDFISFPQGTSYVSPKLGAVCTDACGLGIAAKNAIDSFERVLQFSGELFTLNEYFTLPSDIQPYPHQIGPDLLLGPRSKAEIGVAELLNHSCDANVGFLDSVTVVTIRPIAAGEELTIDYAFSESFPGFSMSCLCGSVNCRGIVTSNDWLLAELREKYFHYFQPYLKERLSNPSERLEPRPATPGRRLRLIKS